LVVLMAVVKVYLKVELKAEHLAGPLVDVKVA
jgi:hypothetical protein